MGSVILAAITSAAIPFAVAVAFLCFSSRTVAPLAIFRSCLSSSIAKSARLQQRKAYDKKCRSRSREDATQVRIGSLSRLPTLPAEILMHIVSYLPIREFHLHTLYSSHCLSDLCSNPGFWKELCQGRVRRTQWSIPDRNLREEEWKSRVLGWWKRKMKSGELRSCSCCCDTDETEEEGEKDMRREIRLMMARKLARWVRVVLGIVWVFVVVSFRAYWFGVWKNGRNLGLMGGIHEAICGKRSEIATAQVLFLVGVFVDVILAKEFKNTLWVLDVSSEGDGLHRAYRRIGDMIVAVLEIVSFCVLMFSRTQLGIFVMAVVSVSSLITSIRGYVNILSVLASTFAFVWHILSLVGAGGVDCSGSSLFVWVAAVVFLFLRAVADREKFRL